MLEFLLFTLVYLFVYNIIYHCSKLKQELFRTFFICMMSLPGFTLQSCVIQYPEHACWIVSELFCAWPEFICVICDTNQGACIKLRFWSYTIYAERPDIKSQYSSLLYQLLLDPSDRVCFEAINCVLGKGDNTERYNDAEA